VRQFYSAVRGERPSPLVPANIADVACARDQILALMSSAPADWSPIIALLLVQLCSQTAALLQQLRDACDNASTETIHRHGGPSRSTRLPGGLILPGIERI